MRPQLFKRPFHTRPLYTRCLLAGAPLLIGSLCVAPAAIAADRDRNASPSQADGTRALVASALSVSEGAPVRSPARDRIDGLGTAMDPAGLATLRGGESIELDIVENTASANGVVSGNHAENIISGTNTLAGEAFSGANGINTAIQNSGSNVLIQNAMVVNVQFADPGL